MVFNYISILGVLAVSIMMTAFLLGHIGNKPALKRKNFGKNKAQKCFSTCYRFSAGYVITGQTELGLRLEMLQFEFLPKRPGPKVSNSGVYLLVL